MIDDRLEGDSLVPEDEELRVRERGGASSERRKPRGEDAIAALFAAAEDDSIDRLAFGAAPDADPEERADAFESEPEADSQPESAPESEPQSQDGEASAPDEEEAAGAESPPRPDARAAIDALFGAASDAGVAGAPSAAADDEDDEQAVENTAAAPPEQGGASGRFREVSGDEEVETSGEEDETSSILQMGADELRHAIEAVLFAVGEPVTVRTLAELFGVSGPEVREAVETLKDEYVDSGRAFRLEEIAGGVQILTLPTYNSWIRRLRQKQREGRLSAAALETLAVIAYKQPITKADLENIRGVQCGPTLKTLIDRGLIQVVGKDESLGRPLLYGTTRRFLESFGLSSLRDLPQPEVLPRAPGEGPPIGPLAPERAAEAVETAQVDEAVGAIEFDPSAFEEPASGERAAGADLGELTDAAEDLDESDDPDEIEDPDEIDPVAPSEDGVERAGATEDGSPETSLDERDDGELERPSGQAAED